MNRFTTYELKKTLLAITLLVSVVGSNDVEADWSGFAKVTGFNVFDGVFFVQLTPSSVVDTVGCGNFGGWHIFVKETIDSSQKSYKDFYALVLTAFLLNITISIHSDNCFQGFPKGNGIQFSP